MCNSSFLTSGWGLVLRGEDDKAKALIVFTLQSNIKALWPRWLGGQDSVGHLDTRHLGRAVDQGRCYLLRLLDALLLLAVIWQMTTHRNTRECLHSQTHIWIRASQLVTNEQLFVRIYHSRDPSINNPKHNGFIEDSNFAARDTRLSTIHLRWKPFTICYS